MEKFTKKRRQGSLRKKVTVKKKPKKSETPELDEAVEMCEEVKVEDMEPEVLLVEKESEPEVVLVEKELNWKRSLKWINCRPHRRKLPNP